MTLDVVAHTLATPQVQSLPAAVTVGVLLSQWTSHLYAAAAHAASDLLHFTSLHFEMNLKYFIRVLNTSPHACNVCIYTCTVTDIHQTYSWSEPPPCVAVIWRKKACLENHVTSIRVILVLLLLTTQHSLKNLLDFWPKLGPNIDCSMLWMIQVK